MTLFMCPLLLTAIAAAPVTDADKPPVEAVMGFTYGKRLNSRPLEVMPAKLTSKAVLATAVLRPDVTSLPIVRAQADPAGWLGKSLQVKVDPKEWRLTLTLSGAGSRREQAILLNAVVDSFAEEELRAWRQPLEETIASERKHLGPAQKDLAAASLRLSRCAPNPKNEVEAKERKVAAETVATFDSVVQLHARSILAAERQLNNPPRPDLVPITRARP